MTFIRFVKAITPPLAASARLMRLHTPTGALLLLLPCWWGLALTAPINQTANQISWLLWAQYAGLFALGAIVMRAGGCIINDYFDRDIDRQVARTAQRPLASGAVTPSQAAVLLVILLLIGGLILLAFDDDARLAGLLALPLVLLYPLAKRVTYWPQIVLGIVFNWGIFIGWFALRDGWHPAVATLYLAALCWTVGYDTIYAYQDLLDDLAHGVKSSAVWLQRKGGGRITGKGVVVIIYGVCLSLLITTLLLLAAPLGSYLWIAVAAGFIAWHLRAWQVGDPADCFIRFRANIPFAFLVLIGLVLATP